MADESIKLHIIGTGYVGLVTGVCLAELGHHVTCVDVDEAKISNLKKGKVPIFEPGLEVMIPRLRDSGRLHFTNDISSGLKESEAVFIAVGTPAGEEEGAADLRYVYEVAESLADTLPDNMVVVTKSTVPVGTGDQISRIISKSNPRLAFHIASNPEFLREGCAVKDFLEPDRIIIGTESDHARAVMTRVYEPLTNRGVNLLFTDIRTSELTKYAANAFLATKIAFINEMADMCERVGADIEDVANGMGMDHRIGRNYLSPGPGFGGSCFPKDTLALRKMAKDFNVGMQLVHSVITSNDQRKVRLIDKVKKATGSDLKGKHVAVLGLAFKANTDDTRYSPALVLIEQLEQAGAVVHAYDPEAMEHTKRHFTSKKVKYVSHVEKALKGADVAVVVTEWDEFKYLPLSTFKHQMKTPVVVDFRNLFRSDEMKAAGISYHSVGRK